jgi:Uncharacterized protein conserved in bacteria
MCFRLLQSLLVAGLIAVGLLATPAAAQADPPIWIVRDADTEMVLFGSVHSLPPGISWRSPELEAALTRADLVVFEILTPDNPEEQAALYEPMFRQMLADRPLDSVLSAETYARVLATAASLNLPPESLNRMRPWAVALLLDQDQQADLGRSGDLGVDTQIEAALPEGRRTEALDTDALLLASIQAYATFGDSEGEAMILEVLNTRDREKVLDLTVERAWSRGELGPLLEEVAEMKREAPLLYQVLLIDRNRGWLPALIRMMRLERRVVVVAGAAHMVGEEGLPAMMRRVGYQVEGPGL